VQKGGFSARGSSGRGRAQNIGGGSSCTNMNGYLSDGGKGDGKKASRLAGKKRERKFVGRGGVLGTKEMKKLRGGHGGE